MLSRRVYESHSQLRLIERRHLGAAEFRELRIDRRQFEQKSSRV